MKSTVITCLAIPALLLTGIAHGNAADYQSSTGLICDSVAQVERWVELVNTGTAEGDALTTVNEEYVNPEKKDTMACAYATIMYEKGDKVGEKKVKNGRIEIFEARIFGHMRNGMWGRVPDLTQYLPFFKLDVARGQAI